MLYYLPPSQKGLTLIEAAVSAAVVGVSLLGVLRLQTQLSKDNADSPVRTAALNAAQQKIEELRAFQRVSGVEKSYENLNSRCGTDNPMETAGTSLTNATLNRVCTVGAEVNGYKPVTVTVSWTDTRGEKQQVRLSSYIAKTDPEKAGMLFAGVGTPVVPVVPVVPVCTTTFEVALKGGNDTLEITNGSCLKNVGNNRDCSSSVSKGNTIVLKSKDEQKNTIETREIKATCELVNPGPSFKEK